jgi:hypothetical protein
MNPKYKSVYYRLIALWAVCEAFAGGILHAFKIPFSGMVVNSLAITCIIFIAKYAPTRWSILKATILVCIFKMMLSPHSPPTAYIAVGFQGLMGHLLFLSQRYFILSGVVLGALTLVESSIQRLLVLFIVYGKTFWQALDTYLQKLTGANEMTSYSLILAGLYVSLHFLVGIFVGLKAGHWAQHAHQWRLTNAQYLVQDLQIESLPQASLKKKKRKKLWVVLWLILLALYMHAWLFPQEAVLTLDGVNGIILRAGLIILGWWILLRPVVQWCINKFMTHQKQKLGSDLTIIHNLLPEIRTIFIKSWDLSADKKGLSRLTLFVRILMLNILK